MFRKQTRWTINFALAVAAAAILFKLAYEIVRPFIG